MATHFTDRVQYLDSTVLTVSVGHLCSHFYLLVLPPLFPVLKADLGFSNAQLGLLVAMISGSLFLLQTPTGALVDRLGGKRVFVIGTGVTASGIALMGFTESYAILIGLAVLSGVGQAAYHPADYAMLNAVSDDQTQGKVFSVHLFAGHLGFVLAPIIVGGLIVFLPWQTILLVVGMAGLGYAALARLTLDPVYLELLEDHSPDSSVTRDSIRKLAGVMTTGIVLLFVVYATLTFGAQGLRAFTTVFVVEGYGFPQSIGNFALTAFTALTVVGVLVGGIIVDRLGAVRTFLVSLGGASATATAGVFGVVGVNAGAVVAVFGLLGLCVGAAFPARDSLVSRMVVDDQTGTGFGFVFTGLALGSFLGPAIFGVVVDMATVELALGLAVVGFAVAGGLTLLASQTVPEGGTSTDSG